MMKTALLLGKKQSHESRGGTEILLVLLALLPHLPSVSLLSSHAIPLQAERVSRDWA